MSILALLSCDKDKAVRISFEFAVYEVWEDQGPVKLRLKANKPLDMKGQQDVFIKPLEIVPVSAQGRACDICMTLFIGLLHIIIIQGVHR